MFSNCTSLTSLDVSNFDTINVTDMWAMFRAIGPNIRHAQVKPFRNVSVYTLLCNLLGITPAENDGCIDDVKSIIKDN